MSDRGAYRRRKHEWAPSAAQGRVLDALAGGLTNAEIAIRLGISPETVKWHVSELLAAAGANDREELRAWWSARNERRRIAVPWIKLILPPAAAAILLAVVFVAAEGQSKLTAREPEPDAPLLTQAERASAIPPWSSPTPIPDAVLRACPDDRQTEGTVPTGLRQVDPRELAGQGLVSLGKLIDAPDCALLSENRADRAFFRVPLSATVLGSDLTAIAVRSVWHAERQLIVGGNQITLTMWSTGTLYPGPGGELTVSALDSSSNRHRAAVDSTGVLWIDPRPLGSLVAVAESTGTALDVSAATQLARLQPNGRPEKYAQPVFYFNACQDRQACSVSYRPFGPTLAPVAGTLRCLAADQLKYDQGGHPIGVLELDAGSFKLRFTEYYTFTPNSRQSFHCATRQVEIGEVIGEHYHYGIEAFGPDGSPLSLVVSQNSTLFVGKISHEELACPCEPGN